jgi:hypothetical protein
MIASSIRCTGGSGALEALAKDAARGDHTGTIRTLLAQARLPRGQLPSAQWREEAVGDDCPRPRLQAEAGHRRPADDYVTVQAQVRCAFGSVAKPASRIGQSLSSSLCRKI